MCIKLKSCCCAIGVLFFAATNQTVNADDCEYYKEGAGHYQQLRRMGGNGDDMNFWKAKLEEMEDKLRQCNQSKPLVKVASGQTETPQKITPARRALTPLRSSTSADLQLQRLIATCNYWINLSNENPSDDNINFRDPACRAVDKQEKELEYPNSPTINSPVNSPISTGAARSLKDCIKPNNLIDQEVSECVKGNLEPVWKKQR